MITPQPITAALISDSATAYYTTPASVKRAQLKSVTIANPEAEAYTVTLHLVPAAGTASDTNTVIYQKSVAAGETWQVPELENKVLLAGGMLQALASTASKLNIQGTVLEYT